MIIYLIINLINGKMYIGKSKGFDIISSQSRPYKHLHGHGSERVYSSVLCHGIENFRVVILYKRNYYIEDLLNDLEKDYIKQLNTLDPNGYNLTPGGEGGDTFSNKSDEEKTEIGRKRSETWANKSDEEKDEISRKQSVSQLISQNLPEVVKNNSEAHKIWWAGRSMEEIAEAINKQVAAYLLTWENKSKEEKLEIGNKISFSNKKAWSIKSEEERVNFGKEHSDIYQSNWQAKPEMERTEAIKHHSDVQLISQNKPETKEKKAEGSKITWADPEIRKKRIEGKNKYNQHLILHKHIIDINCKYCVELKPKSTKTEEEKEETIRERLEIGKYGSHIRWDVNRGIINPNCKFCIEGK